MKGPIPPNMALAVIGKELELPPDFLKNLVLEDDWSLIIKCHALIETLLTQLIVEQLKQPKLLRSIASLSLAKRRELLDGLDADILTKPYRRALEAITTLRNRLAHNIRYVQFSFADEYGDETKRRQFVESFQDLWPELTPETELGVELRARPAYSVWLASIILSSRLHANILGTRGPEGFRQALIAALEASGENPADQG